VLIGVNLTASVLMVTLYRDRWTVHKPAPNWKEIVERMQQDAADGAGDEGEGSQIAAAEDERSVATDEGVAAAKSPSAAGDSSIAVETSTEDDSDVRLLVWSRSPIQPIEYYDDDARAVTTWGAPMDVAAIEESAEGDPGRACYYIDDASWYPLDEAQIRLLAGAGFERAFTIDGVTIYRLRREEINP